jgi:hypothetical protein
MSGLHHEDLSEFEVTRRFLQGDDIEHLPVFAEPFPCVWHCPGSSNIASWVKRKGGGTLGPSVAMPHHSARPFYDKKIAIACTDIEP